MSYEDSAKNHGLTEQEVSEIAILSIAAKRKAYCPYSNFRVGAAILVEPHPQLDRTIYQGSNVEVASTPCGICAERCALAPIVARIERPDMPRIRAIAVSTDIFPPASPCGFCRQMIREFCEETTPVYMYGRSKEDGQDYTNITDEEELKICGKPLILDLGTLLPYSFGPNGKTPLN